MERTNRIHWTITVLNGREQDRVRLHDIDTPERPPPMDGPDIPTDSGSITIFWMSATADPDEDFSDTHDHISPHQDQERTEHRRDNQENGDGLVYILNRFNQKTLSFPKKWWCPLIFLFAKRFTQRYSRFVSLLSRFF